MELYVFACIVAIIWLAVQLHKQKGKNAEIERELRDLNQKAYYNYGQIKKLTAKLNNISVSNNVAKTEEADVKSSDAVQQSSSQNLNNTAGSPAPTANRTTVQNSGQYSGGSTNNIGRKSTHSNPAQACRPQQQMQMGFNPYNSRGFNANSTANPSIAQCNYGNIQNQQAPLSMRLSNIERVVGKDEPDNSTHCVPNNCVPNKRNELHRQYRTVKPERNPASSEMQFSVIRSEQGLPMKTNPASSEMQSEVSASATPEPQKNTKPSRKKTSIENWFGSHVLNIVASLLVFIGLIFLGTLVYEYLSNFVKILAMYLISGGIIALGIMFSKKHRSYFSVGLTGCGCGALFISVLLTHIYFHAISDITAFSLLAVWTGFTLFISKKIDSTHLSITAHMGMALSVCFAFSMGFSPDRIFLPVIYQIISITVVVVGNIFCCRKTYRFGLIVSMLIMLYSSFVMSVSLLSREIDVIPTAVLFTVQFLGSSFLSYLLAVTATKLNSNSVKSGNGTKEKKLSIWLHIINKSVWCVSTILNIFYVFSVIFSVYTANSYGAWLNSTLLLAAIIAVHLAVTVYLREKLDFSEVLSNISVYFTTGVMSAALIFLSLQRTSLHTVTPTFMFLVALAVIVIIKLTKNLKLTNWTLLLVSIDGLFMLFGGYKYLSGLGTVALSFGYTALISAIIVCLWIIQNQEERDRLFLFFKGYTYFWVNASIISILNILNPELCTPLTLSVLTAVHILLHAISYGKGKGKSLEYIIRCASAVIIFISFTAISGAKYHYELTAIYILLLIVTAVLFVLKSSECIKSEYSLLQALPCVAFTSFVCVIINGYTDVFSYSCYLSIIWMATASICMLADLKLKRTGIFYYGLSVLIIGALKVIIFDSSSPIFEKTLSLILCSLLFIITHLILSVKENVQTEKYAHLLISGLILFANFAAINSAKGNLTLIILYVLLTLITAILFVVKSHECIKSEYPILQALAGLYFTCFVCTVIGGFTNTFSSDCYLTIICMATAAICMLSDLKLKRTGLLYYGLAVLIAGALKIAIFDSSSSSAFDQALSLILCSMLFILTHFILSVKENIQTAKYAHLLASGLILFADFTAIHSAKGHINSIALYIILTLITAILFIVKSLECVKSKYPILQALAGLYFTCFICTVIGGFTDIYSLSFMLSTVIAVTAAICILLEKRFNSIGLKYYGIITTAICIIKLITLDIIFVANYERVISIIIGTVICILFYVTSYGKSLKKPLKNILRCESAIVLYAGIIAISRTKHHPDLTALYILLFLIAAGLFAAAVYDSLKLKSTAVHILIGITFTIFVKSVVNGYSDALSVTYIASIISMITALICIAAGFKIQAKGLRLYGLVLVIVFVLKLVTIDISSANSIARVSAFILGGVICFAISGIYNKFERLYVEKTSSAEENK